MFFSLKLKCVHVLVIKFEYLFICKKNDIGIGKAVTLVGKQTCLKSCKTASITFSLSSSSRSIFFNQLYCYLKETNVQFLC